MLFIMHQNTLLKTSKMFIFTSILFCVHNSYLLHVNETFYLTPSLQTLAIMNTEEHPKRVCYNKS